MVTEKHSGKLGKDLVRGCCRADGDRSTDLRTDELENAIYPVIIHDAFTLFDQVQELEAVVPCVLQPILLQLCPA